MNLPRSSRLPLHMSRSKRRRFEFESLESRVMLSVAPPADLSYTIEAKARVSQFLPFQTESFTGTEAFVDAHPSVAAEDFVSSPGIVPFASAKATPSGISARFSTTNTGIAVFEAQGSFAGVVLEVENDSALLGLLPPGASFVDIQLTATASANVETFVGLAFANQANAGFFVSMNTTSGPAIIPDFAVTGSFNLSKLAPSAGGDEIRSFTTDGFFSGLPSTGGTVEFTIPARLKPLAAGGLTIRLGGGVQVGGLAVGGGFVDTEVMLDISNIAASARLLDGTPLADLGIDVEFFPQAVSPDGPPAIGNLVFHDANNNGLFEPELGDSGIDGVVLNLYGDANGNSHPDPAELLQTTVSSGGGLYRFENLAPAVDLYAVEVARSNFDPGGPLENKTSSTGNGFPHPNDHVDNDDNGAHFHDPSFGVITQRFSLNIGLEPDFEDGDANTNLTVDFGFRPNTPPVADAGGPYTVDEGSPLALDASGSFDAEDTVSDLTYEWDIDYDGVTFDVDAVGVGPVFYASGLDGPATRNIALRVTDSGGLFHLNTTTINITNAAPLISADSSIIIVDEGETALNTGSFSDPGGDQLFLNASPGIVTQHELGTWHWSFETTDGPGETQQVAVTATESDASILDFDGNDRVIIANQPPLNPSRITVETWVSFDRLASDADPAGKGAQFLVTKGGDRTIGAYRLLQNTGNRLVFSIGPCCMGADTVTVFANVPSLTTNRWYHVAGTYDGSVLRLYLDGVQIAESSFVGVPVGNSSPLNFSYNDVGGFPYHLDGQMDEVRIWDHARTAAEIQATMSTRLAGAEAGLVGYWAFDESLDSQTVLDASPNGSHGHLGSTTGDEADDPKRLPAGASSTITFDLIVNNVPPTFEVGPDATLQPAAGGALHRLGIPFIDPGADFWTGTVNFGDSAGDLPLTVDQVNKTVGLSHQYLAEGTYTVSVTLDDGDDGTHTDSFNVTVLLNTPPVADAGGPYVVDEGGLRILNAAGSSDDEDALVDLSFEWDFDYDGTTFDTDATGVSPVFDASGLDGPLTRHIAVRVTDTGGLSEIAATTVTVMNVAPAAAFNNDGPVDEGGMATVSFAPRTFVTFDFAAIVQSLSELGAGLNPPLDESITVGTPITGTISYDPSSAPRFPVPNTARYSGGRLTAQVGNYRLSTGIEIEIWNNFMGTDRLAVTSDGTEVFSNGAQSFGEGSSQGNAFSHLTFVDNDGLIFASLELPLAPPDLNDLELARGFIVPGNNTGNYVSIDFFTITSLTLRDSTEPIATDPSIADITAGLNYSYDFDNDGTFEIVGNTSPTATVPPEFLDDGPAMRTVRGRIQDKDGGYTDYTTTITIDNVPPNFEAGADETLDPSSAGVFSRDGITFTDPGADVWTGTVNFGDGSVDQPLTIDQTAKTFDLAHTYAGEGAFTVTVTIQDEDGGSHTDSFLVSVNLNTPPTADAGDPYSVDEGGSLALDASGSFDSEDAPADLTYEWDFDYDGATFHTDASGVSPLFDASALDGPTNRTIALRTTDSGGLSDIDQTTIEVHNLAPTINSLTAPGPSAPGQEGVQIALAGSFNDAGLLDTHTATVDWGDGSPFQSLTLNGGSGAGTLAGTHIYQNGGVYTITIELADDDGGTVSQSVTTTIAGVGLRADGTLEIIGTAGGNAGLVRRSGSQIIVDFPGVSAGSKSFPLTGVERIAIDLGAGDDVFFVAGGVSLPVTIHGGDGNDVISGGGGLSLLLGGNGNDLLLGGGGRNVLVGGLGQDLLFGGGNQDFLLGGSVQLDDDPEADDDDDPALALILTEWADSNSYPNRVDSIAALLDDIDDGEADLLIGGNGRDLFFDALGDNLLDVSNLESVL